MLCNHQFLGSTYQLNPGGVRKHRCLNPIFSPSMSHLRWFIMQQCKHVPMRSTCSLAIFHRPSFMGSLNGTPFLRGSNLMQMYGHIEGAPLFVVHYVGWYHIMTPVFLMALHALSSMLSYFSDMKTCSFLPSESEQHISSASLGESYQND